MMSYSCDKCGNCCRSLRFSDVYKDLDNGQGVCKYLCGNLCSIYEYRPLICRIDESYEIFFKNQMSKDEYYRLNYECCKYLKGV